MKLPALCRAGLQLGASASPYDLAKGFKSGFGTVSYRGRAPMSLTRRIEPETRPVACSRPLLLDPRHESAPSDTPVSVYGVPASYGAGQ